MIRLRSVLLVLAMIVYSAVFAAIVLMAAHGVTWLFRYRMFQVHARICRQLLKRICGLDSQVHGIENLPDGPFVAVANHQSAWETLTLPAFLPPFAWVLKDSLVRIPWFGWALRRLEPIAIDRSDRSGALRKLMAEGTKRLREGVPVVVFPEGTRFHSGDLGEFQAGAILLALSAKVPVVPIGHDAGCFWPGGTLRIRPGTIHLRVGVPVTDHLERRVPAREMRERLQREVAALASRRE